MTKWFYPSGTAVEGDWSVSLGTPDSTVVLDDWGHTGVKVADLVYPVRTCL